MKKKISIDELTKKITNIFHEDCRYLNCQAPTNEPTATEYISLMIELIEIVKSVSDEFLTNKGSLLVKVFHGEPHEKLMNYVKSNFQQVRIRKPSASRPNSSELYVLAIGKNYE